jgi:adenosine deaminase
VTVDPWQMLPKIELHCHLDASVRVETVADIGRDLGLELPDPLAPALEAPEVCDDLADYLRCLDLALEVLQRPQDLERVARELIEDMARDGVIHAEVRFAPQLHTRKGLTRQQALDAVCAGLEAGSASSGITVGTILCCLRHRDSRESNDVARLAVANRDKVCALDLAGDEGGHPEAAPHAVAFDLAREAGLKLTAHAGENAGARSVREVLDRLGAQRVGHGIRCMEDQELTDRLAREGIPLEICPKSNVQTRAVESFASHPIDRLLARGVPVTVSTDGRTSSSTTLTDEFRRLRAEFGWGLEEFAACQRNAARAVFAPDRVKDELLARLQGLP